MSKNKYHLLLLFGAIVFSHTKAKDLEYDVENTDTQRSWGLTTGVGAPSSYLTTVNTTQFTSAGSLIATYTITSPGFYTFVADVGSVLSSDDTSIGGQTALYINSSDVTIDLGGHTLYYNAAIANIDGIEINTGKHNITIKNGNIAAFTGHGIIVNSNCNNIKLEDLNISNCVGPAVYLKGATGAGNEVNDVEMINCTLSNTVGKSSVDAVGLKIDYGWNILVSDSDFLRSVSSADDAYGVLVTSGTNIRFENCQASGCEGDSAVGFGFVGTVGIHGCVLKNCTANNNYGLEAAAGYAYGFAFTSAISNNDSATANLISGFVLENCTASGNKGTVSADGFYSGAADYFYFNNCKAFDNVAIDVAGSADVTDGGHGFSCYQGKSHIFENCLSVGNRLLVSNATASSAGFFLEDTDNMVFQNCEAYNNADSSTTTKKAGFYFSDSSNTCNNTILRNCKSANHLGTNSYGFYDTDTTSSSLIISCLGFGNTTNYSVTYGVGTVFTDAAQTVGTLANLVDNPYISLSIATS